MMYSFLNEVTTKDQVREREGSGGWKEGGMVKGEYGHVQRNGRGEK